MEEEHLLLLLRLHKLDLALLLALLLETAGCPTLPKSRLLRTVFLLYGSEFFEQYLDSRPGHQLEHPLRQGAYRGVKLLGRAVQLDQCI